ncbi:ATP-binding cassette domain-containing protein [Lactobacillus helsingborgensis]|uniref:ABC transporter ATP-binding protein n=1 Tax=Lactobacillus helsingborgensis TaxID=1218494 RepID=UPI001650B8CF|nr:ATP-binding cassette domain-containing protein [Lactobacillus helsingborgensis]MBC6356702.1 ATP-binding cassette domain-containing protein [Lactobacillus helsingborgensis]
MQENIINVDKISKTFLNKNAEKKAIDSVSFKIKSGEITGYIGKNGAGKSTMIKILCGILTPSCGKATVKGITPYKNRIKNAQNIGAVFGQRTQLWWDLPLIDSYNILRKIYKVGKRDFENRLDYFDHAFNISKLFKSLVRTLSLGERMKADIVASMLHNPSVLFLDEPTIGLDYYSKKSMRKVIKDLNSNFGTTIVITTHDMQDIEQLCERVIIVDKGAKLYDDTLRNLKERFGTHKHIKIKNMDQEDAAILLRKLDLPETNYIYDYKKNILELSLDNSMNKSSLQTLLNIIFLFCSPNDITVKDDDIESIIERIHIK